MRAETYKGHCKRFKAVIKFIKYYIGNQNYCLPDFHNVLDAVKAELYTLIVCRTGKFQVTTPS